MGIHRNGWSFLSLRLKRLPQSAAKPTTVATSLIFSEPWDGLPCLQTKSQGATHPIQYF